MKKALLHYEFHQNLVGEHKDHNNKDQEVISTIDFIKSLFTYLPYKQCKVYYDKSLTVEACKGTVSFYEYVLFHQILDNIDELREYVKIYQYISQEQFTKFVREQEALSSNSFFKTRNIIISDNTITAIFKVLDLDGNGIIDQSEIMGIFEGRHVISSGRGTSDDLAKTVKENGAFAWG